MITQTPGSPAPSVDAPINNDQNVARGRNESRTPARRPAPVSEVDSLLNPKALLNSLRRRWKTALIVAAPLALVAAAIAWKSLPATYTSFALLRMASIEPKLVFETAERKADFDTYRQTQAALITSRFVLTAALRKPGVAELETIRQQAYPQQWLESQLEVGTNRSPEIMRIALKGEQPSDLAAIVNAVKDAYLEEVVNAERKDRLARLSDLERIFAETDEKVRVRQSRVEKLARQLGTGDSKALTIKQQMALEYFAQLQREHSRVRFELMREQLDEATGNKSAVIPDVADDTPADIAAAATESTGADPARTVLARRIVKQRDLIARYEKQVVDKNHPSLVEHRRLLKDLESQYEELLADVPRAGGPSLGRRPGRPSTPRQSRREMLARQEEVLREELERYSTLAETIGTSSFELEAMQTELSQISKVADRISGEIEALRIELQSPPRVVPLQSAEVPQRSDIGRKVKVTGMAGLGTFGAIMGVFLLLDLRLRKVASTDDVTGELNLPLLGTLPPEPGVAGGLGGASRELARQRWHFSLDESVDSIRSLVLRESATGTSPQTILITSATSHEGKTTVASELARSLARAGRRTLLIDFDLRRPSVHTRFEMSNERGMTDLLTGKSDWTAVTVETADPQLSVLPAGRPNDAALQALSRGEAGKILSGLKSEFDSIVIDTSPLLLVSDGAILGRLADGAVLVVRRDVSCAPFVAAARDRLSALRIPILGAVMLGVRSGLQASVYEYQERHRVPAAV